MKTYRIVDRGDGPKIEGTRITVYAIFEYLEMKRSRKWIASLLGLSSRQVQAAMDYIAEHRADVQTEYQKGLSICLHVDCHAIDNERWEAAYLTSLQLLKQFPGPLARCVRQDVGRF